MLKVKTKKKRIWKNVVETLDHTKRFPFLAQALVNIPSEYVLFTVFLYENFGYLT